MRAAQDGLAEPDFGVQLDVGGDGGVHSGNCTFVGVVPYWQNDSARRSGINKNTAGKGRLAHYRLAVPQPPILLI